MYASGAVVGVFGHSPCYSFEQAAGVPPGRGSCDFLLANRDTGSLMSHSEWQSCDLWRRLGMSPGHPPTLPGALSMS